MPFTQKVQEAEEYFPEAKETPRRAAGLTAMVIMALANAAAGGGLVWYLMKDEPAKLAAETDFAFGKLKAAVIDMGCAAEDSLGTWYLHRPSEPLMSPNDTSSASMTIAPQRNGAAPVPKRNDTATAARARVSSIGR